MFMKELILTALPYAQLISSVVLIVAIILQQTGASLGGAFGTDNFSSGFHTRRGAEKLLFNVTIVTAIIFTVSALLAIVL